MTKYGPRISAGPADQPQAGHEHHALPAGRVGRLGALGGVDQLPGVAEPVASGAVRVALQEGRLRRDP